MGWEILNGKMTDNEEGSWMYMEPNGKSVIDYVIENRKVKKGIRKLEVDSRIDLNHMLVGVWIKGEVVKEARKGEDQKKWIWTEERKKKFRKELGDSKEKNKVGGGVDKNEREAVGNSEEEG